MFFFCLGSKIFKFRLVKSQVRSSDEAVIAVLATCLVNDSRPLGTIQAMFVRKERFDAKSVKKKKKKRLSVKENLLTI